MTRSRAPSILCRFAGIVLLASIYGCGVGSKQTVLETALKNDGQRREAFEATLRILDHNPKYVDEFFAAARRHPKTLDRFFADTAEQLKEEDLARMNAWHLVDNPPSLREVMVRTLDAANGNAEAETAIAEAIAERSRISASAITRRPETVERSMRDLLIEIRRRPEARRAFLNAMVENREALAELLVENPEIAKSLAGSTVKEGVKKILKPGQSSR